MCALLVFFLGPQHNSTGSDIFIPIFQMENPRHREVKKPARDHTVAGWSVNTSVAASYCEVVFFLVIFLLPRRSAFPHVNEVSDRKCKVSSAFGSLVSPFQCNEETLE